MATTTATDVTTTSAAAGAGAGSSSTAADVIGFSPGILSTGEPSPSDAGFDSKILCTTKPYDVPVELYQQNRARLLEWFVVGESSHGDEPVPANSILAFQGGKAELRHDTDHEPVFRQESWFHWVFGVREPDCFGVIEVDTKRSILFVPRLPQEYAIWMGKIKTPEDFKAEYGVDEVRFTDEVPKFMEDVSPARLYTNYGKCSDSGNFSAPADFEGKDKYSDVEDQTRLFRALTECRVIKTALELQVMRYASMTSSEAHMAVMAHCRPGLSEYQLESLFKHWTYYHGGIRHMAYTCICATGDNSSVLHYGHAGAPNMKKVVDGDMCLFDMGGEFNCYASDITCSFPANGKFSDDQRLVYTAVLEAQYAVMAALRPGIMWSDMHALAYRVALTHLRDGGLLQGDVDEMMEANLGATFMPHGLGHHIGLDTHDVGGYPEGAERSKLDGFKSLRSIRELKADMTLTVEPGVYFVDHLLDAALADPAKSKFINAEALTRFRGWGGIRLEDVIRITETGMENFTWCPRTIEDVEACCAGTIKSRFELTRRFP